VRAGLDLEVIEKLSPGGQVLNTYELENYPGFVNPIAGWELMQAMEGQVQRLGVNFLRGEVQSLKAQDSFFELRLAQEEVLKAKTVIASSGTFLRKLNIPGEKEFMGKGVSYCATCDGAFYKDKVVAVIGGGNTALEEAFFLTRFAKKVYVIHRRDEFRGSKILQDRVMASDKIEIIYNHIPLAIDGDDKVQGIKVEDVVKKVENYLEVDGVFIFVGFDPNTSFLPEEVLNDKKEVVVDMKMRTSLKGLMAAGDLRINSGRQIVMATSDGAYAALSAYEHLLNL